MKIYFVTSNKDKFMEVERVLNSKLVMKRLAIPEIQAIEASEIVTEKARRAYGMLKKPLIVEDTGLYIRALNGFPGALAKWMLDRIGNEGMCRMLDGFRDRSAYAETCICFHDGKRCRVFSGRINGAITRHPRGNCGFGYDSVFQPDGHARTFGEMSMEEKNSISMRAGAALKLKAWFGSRAGARN